MSEFRVNPEEHQEVTMGGEQVTPQLLDSMMARGELGGPVDEEPTISSPNPRIPPQPRQPVMQLAAAAGDGMIDPWALKAKKREVRWVEFTDDEFPDHPVRMGLWKLNGLEMTKALQEARAMTEEFVNEDGSPRRLYPNRSGAAPLELSQSTIIVAFFTVYAQMGVPEEKRYGFDALIGINVNLPGVFLKLTAFINQHCLPSGKENIEGNSRSMTQSSVASYQKAGNTQQLPREATSTNEAPTDSSEG